MSSFFEHDADQCLLVASDALKRGDYDKAEKFIKKANNFCPTHRADCLLEKVRIARASSTSFVETKSPSSSSTEPSPANYSDEQAKEVRHFLKLKDYYEILGITKSASEQEIQKAYRKMALKFHPDRNNAPQSSDVFKSISHAYSCLSNPDKRRIYDRFGDERGPISAATSSTARYYESELSPEDLFNMFFGGQVPVHANRHYRREHMHREHHPQQGGGGLSILHLLPFAVLLLFSYFSAPGNEGDVFSLDLTSSHNQPRVSHSGIEYYVGSVFNRRYAHDRRAIAHLENLVEETYVLKCLEDCDAQKAARKRAIAQAKKQMGTDRSDHLKRAYNMELPACDAYSNFISPVEA